MRAALAAESGAPRTRHRAADASPLYTNRLVLEPSPYLQQHAHNPVDWYPWGDEAFERARAEHKPVLLSVGYSTCHWCHVMEESPSKTGIAEYPTALRGDQGRPRAPPGRRRDLPRSAATDGRARRLADDRVADTGSPAVLRWHVLPPHDGVADSASVSHAAAATADGV
jgi:hypothetical protein